MTASGERDAQILFEELHYNKESQPFRVLCLDVPLVGAASVFYTHPHAPHSRSA
jgi:hypothetical protein